MITRRNLLIGIGLGTVSVAFPSLAQQGKIARIGYLSAGSADIDESLLAGFRQGLKELGYLEGKNIAIEQRYAAGRAERLPELAAELVRLKADVILGAGDPAALAAKKATSTIPIVVHAADPIGTGLVASLARPGGNVTGMSDLHAELVPKRLEFLKELVPSLSHAAFLSNPANPTCSLQLKDLRTAAPAVGVTVLVMEAEGADDIDRAFATMRKEPHRALIVCGDRTLSTHRRQIFELATKSRLPAMYSNRRFVDAGGLMSYGTNLTDFYRRLATYVDKILKGAKPADLPVEQPTKFELVINLKAAKALGISVPRSTLSRADEVID